MAFLILVGVTHVVFLIFWLLSIGFRIVAKHFKNKDDLMEVSDTFMYVDIAFFAAWVVLVIAFMH